ncbi:hypothetical protein [Lentzea sp. CA-135723]|uniref:hypothetical protein n=1 Tax=Lentzea sp. CA-135723 TaxID=3239950 RepID=UPI003D8DB3B8
MKRVTVLTGVLATLLAAGVAGAAPAVAAPEITPLQVTSYISNQTNISVGVSKDNVAGPYQALLPANRRTDGSPLYWSRAVSFYVGAGSCVDAWGYHGGAWRFQRTVAGAEEFAIKPLPGESVARWELRNHRRC